MTVLTVLLTLPFSACVDEQNLDQCPMEVTLTFDYLENGIDRFARDINTVDVFVFDANGVFLFTQHVSKSDLNRFQSVRLDLLPGDYQVVCWANLTDHSGLSSLVPGVTTIDEAYVQIASSATGDALYFAPGGTNGMGDNKLHVNTMESTTKNMHFVRANRRINVYIQGIEYTQSGSGAAPSVDANNLWSKYNFASETQSNRISFRQQAHTTTTPNGAMYLTTFYSDLGTITSDMEIVVANSFGKIVAVINLQEYIAQHPNIGANDIDILITFNLDNTTMDLGVSVTLPDWESVDVDGTL
jgi:hypothetical protein